MLGRSETRGVFMFMSSSLIGSVGATCVLVFAVGVAADSTVEQQKEKPRSSPPATALSSAVSVEEATALTQGWALLAQGMPAEAAKRAAEVLAAYPRSAAALALAIEAETSRAGSQAGLSQYERWLGARTLEEPSILRRIATALLREAAKDPQQLDTRIEALRALAD